MCQQPSSLSASKNVYGDQPQRFDDDDDDDDDVDDEDGGGDDDDDDALGLREWKPELCLL